MRSRPVEACAARQPVGVLFGRSSCRCGQHFDQRRPFRLRNERAGKIFIFDRLQAVLSDRARRLASVRRSPGARRRRARPTRVTRSRLRMVSAITSLKVRSAADGNGAGERLAERTVGVGGAFEHDVERQVVEHLRGGCLIQHLEARGDVGLERKLMQQPRAEGVDGLHLEPARRLQRVGEQPPRPRALACIGALAGARLDFLVERGVVERRPLGERRRTRGSPCWRRRPW